MLYILTYVLNRSDNLPSLVSGILSSILSNWACVRVEVCPAASRPGDMAPVHCCQQSQRAGRGVGEETPLQNLEILTWWGMMMIH